MLVLFFVSFFCVCICVRLFGLGFGLIFKVLKNNDTESSHCEI